MKKLQVLEPMHSGHHTNYLMALAPAVSELQARGVIGSAVFTVTAKHLQLLREAGHLDSAPPSIEWDGSLAQTSPGPSMKERGALCESVRARVAAQRADALICTSADYDIFHQASANLRSTPGFWPAESAAMIHYGLPREGLRAKENLKRVAYELSWRLSRWRHLLIVNPLVYQSLRDRGKANPKRYALLPDPVPAVEPMDRTAARLALGLPADGAYIGCVGMMDHRKAIPELLAAYARSGLAGQARLLLAGRLDGRYKDILEREHAELLRTGRIVVIDRPLSDHELMCGYEAVDLHAVLQYRRMNLSANVLKCVAAGKPYVSDRHGYTAMVAERFGAGVVCDVENVDSIAAALEQGLQMSRGFLPNESMRRLIEFHSARNFAAIALASVLGPAVTETLGTTLGWDHAYGRTEAR